MIMVIIFIITKLFTILAMKTHLKITYCEIIEILDGYNKITKYLNLTSYHNTPIQKFFIKLLDKNERFKQFNIVHVLNKIWISDNGWNWTHK